MPRVINVCQIMYVHVSMDARVRVYITMHMHIHCMHRIESAGEVIIRGGSHYLLKLHPTVAVFQETFTI